MPHSLLFMDIKYSTAESKTMTRNKENAEVLYQYFQSVFTQENLSNMPALDHTVKHSRSATNNSYSRSSQEITPWARHKESNRTRLHLYQLESYI